MKKRPNLRKNAHCAKPIRDIKMSVASRWCCSVISPWSAYKTDALPRTRSKHTDSCESTIALRSKCGALLIAAKCWRKQSRILTGPSALKPLCSARSVQLTFYARIYPTTRPHAWRRTSNALNVESQSFARIRFRTPSTVRWSKFIVTSAIWRSSVKTRSSTRTSAQTRSFSAKNARWNTYVRRPGSMIVFKPCPSISWTQ